jgi:hypothetical protein
VEGMNENVRSNKVFDSFTLFKDTISTFFTSTWNTILPDLPGRINDNFQKLKPVLSGLIGYIMFDFWIFFKTVEVVLSGQGSR